MSDDAQAPEKKTTVQEAMEKAGVATLSELHELHGRPIRFDGEDVTIYYIFRGVFSVTPLQDGRQPYGKVADIQVADDGSLTYDTPEGA